MTISAKTLSMLALFCVAMAALESAVVVYLRALYYPTGFSVALQVTDESILGIEVLRELATVVMLFSVAWLTGRTARERFACFLFSFAIWDIGYYAWLKVFINWPLTWSDWDILFLVPFTWLGPVIAPILVSLLMIIQGVLLLKRPSYQVNRYHAACMIVGCVGVLYTFTADYINLITITQSWESYPNLMQNETFVKQASHFVPPFFRWATFIISLLFISAGIVLPLFRRPAYQSLTT